MIVPYFMFQQIQLTPKIEESKSVEIYQIGSKKLFWALNGNSYGVIAFVKSSWFAYPRDEPHKKTNVSHVIGNEDELKKLILKTFHCQIS